ncbi:hypothetical protein F5Y10DRAFT_238741 [Nemania abortiva]|nr:hypothetical protein F5Y10DRAFT_238741 [Nemania abortiva]
MSKRSEEDDGPSGLEITLFENGDEGSNFRTQNDPSAPFQRSNIVERRGAIDIRCTSTDIIHGHLKNGEGPATLIVYEFQFDPRKKARRIATVDIKISFTSEGDGELEVLKISPRGRMALECTSQQETITIGGQANAGVDVLGAELGSDWTWEKVVSRETTDATTVFGSIDLPDYRNYGPPSAASWTLLENQSLKNGVPAYLKTAVLLSRKQENEGFCGTFEIKTQVDLISRVSRLFGRTPKDDPVRYNPTLRSKGKLVDYDMDSLDDIDLQALSRVSFTNYES